MPADRDCPHEWDVLRRRIIGLGERSIHKSYYPQLQQRLNELQRFKALLDGSNEGIFLIRLPDASVTDVNEYACQQLGYSWSELQKMDVFDLVQSEDIPNVRAFLGSLERIPQGQSMITKFVRSDGTRFPVEVSMRLVTFDSTQYVVAMTRDITERLRMEKELQRIQTLESLGILAGGIAHDFNNSLTTLMNQLALAKMHLDDPKSVLEKLTFAENACSQAKSLTQQLLTFAKGGEPIRSAVSIVGLINDAVRLVLAGTKVKSVLDVPEDLLPVDVDPGQITQVLNNVLINAVQAMPDGGMVSISAKNVFAGFKDGCPPTMGDHLSLSIADNGPGIPHDILTKIFDPFFTTKPSGSGLGLALSHSIIRKHNGMIHAESEQGRGTTFTICLPVAKNGPSCREDPVVALEDHDQPATILFMDDDAMIRASMEELLQELGYSTILVQDGDGALDALRKVRRENSSVDIAIMDLTIPGGMGGAEAVGELKAIDPRIKAVVSSGYGMAPIMSRYKEHGFDAVLPKPYTVSELRRVIQRLLDERAEDAP